MKLKFLIGSLFLLSAFSLPAQYFDYKVAWNEGVEYMQRGDYLRGLERLNEILIEFPDNIEALHNRSICLRYLGDIEGSCVDIHQIHTLKPIHKLKISDLYCNQDFKIELLTRQYYRGTKIYPELGYRPKYSMADTLRGALRLERNCYDVIFYNLTIRILPFKKRIEGTNEIWFKGVKNSKIIQVDLFENFTVNRIVQNGKDLKFWREFQAIFIELPDTIVPGLNYKLTIEYSGKPLVAPHAPWDGGFVWAHDKKLNRWAGVACEQLGASSWWPNKDHLSDKPDSMAINFEVPEKYQAISNGRLRDIVLLKDGFTRYEWFVDYPINNYNVTFYMGKYTEFTDTLNYSGKNLVMRYHVLPYHLDKARVHFRQAKDVISFYNDSFGPFPFWKDDFRMVESPYEGMEHQTAIAYGNAFSNKKNSVEYINNQFDYIIVHEAAHEWWGNAVAAGDMADIWLHEGFATYTEFLFIEHTLGYNASMEEVQNYMQYIYNVWPLVQNRNVNENTFASNDVYTKGATLLHCLRATMDNDSLFKKMLYDFNMDHRFKIVTSSDFIQYVNNYAGINLTPLFNKFLYDSRIPVLSYNYKRKGTDLVLKYKWTEVEDGFTMPFSIETISNKDAIRLVATTQEQEITLKNTESFTFFNLMKSVINCPHNGLTYFWTKCNN
jgi:aminopeptidase N